MNSFNHYAYGAIGDWLFKNAAGIKASPGAPGFQQFELSPEPDAALKFLRSSFEGPHGLIESSWKWTGKGKTAKIEYSFTVPPNTEALVKLPVVDGKKQFKVTEGASRGELKDGHFVFCAGPGKVAVVQR
jgi:alpha-L-rhamnosidase